MGRGSNADFARLLQIAQGSACELEYQLLLARELGFLTGGVYAPLHERVVEVKKMLSSLLQRVKASSAEN